MAESIDAEQMRNITHGWNLESSATCHLVNYTHHDEWSAKYFIDIMMNALPNKYSHEKLIY